jgi:hypothetical protein
MKMSTDRILTTHVGSLPGSKAVTDVVFAQERDESVADVKDIIRNAVGEVVARRVIESRRGMHRERVFTYRSKPLGKLHSSAWKRAFLWKLVKRCLVMRMETSRPITRLQSLTNLFLHLSPS